MKASKVFSPKLAIYYRKLAGLIPADVHREFYIGEQNLIDIESGEVIPTQDDLDVMVRAYGIEEIDLYEIKLSDIRRQAIALIHDFLCDSNYDKGKKVRTALDLLKLTQGIEDNDLSITERQPSQAESLILTDDTPSNEDDKDA